MWNVWQCWAILLVTLVTVRFPCCLFKTPINHSLWWFSLLLLLLFCYLNCFNNPARSVRNFNVFPLCFAQSSPYLSLISVEGSFFVDWKMRLLLPAANFECRISDQQQKPHNSLPGSLQFSLSPISKNWGWWGRQLAKHYVKAGLQKDSVVVKERSKWNRKKKKK